MIITNDVVVDGDFETIDTVHWVLSGPAQVEYEESSGNHYCQINSTASIMQMVTLTPDTSYTLSFDCRGMIGLVVEVIDLDNGNLIFEKDCNTVPTTAWHTETYTFTTPGKMSSPRLHFQTKWDAQADYIDLDNVSLDGVVIEYHTPEWVDWSNSSGDLVDRYYFKTRAGVPDQHNILFVGDEMKFDFGIVEADKQYQSDNDIDPSYKSKQFVLYAVDDISGERYVLVDKSGSQLYLGGKIYPADI